MVIVWLGLMIVFGVIEAATVGLVSLWFAVGALAALIVAVFSDSILLQIGVFLVGSVATLVIVRPLARKYVNGRRVPTNADRVIGQAGVVVREIDSVTGQGQVELAGQMWSAKGEGEGVIPTGTRVTVLSIEGVKVLVRPAPAQTE